MQYMVFIMKVMSCRTSSLGLGQGELDNDIDKYCYKLSGLYHHDHLGDCDHLDHHDNLGHYDDDDDDCGDYDYLIIQVNQSVVEANQQC